jgi:hypothetical protein
VIRKSFCVFCSLPLMVYTKKHVVLTELAGFSIASIIFTYLVWGEFHFAGLLVFSLLAMATEVIHRMRWRSSVKCKGCGFDPVMYKNNPDLAAATVKTQLAHRKQDPLFMLKSQPKIKPIIRKVKNYRPSKSKDIQL